MTAALKLSEVSTVAIASVKVPKHRQRALRDVSPLRDSIAELGLLQPIVLTPDRVLVAGLHRLKACEALGWEEIPAVVRQVEGLTAELAEIDENLVRNDLTVLERSEQLARRKEIYEALHPDTKSGKAQARGANKAQGRDVSETISPTFATDTARKTGQSARTVQHEVQIARALPQEVRDAIRGTEIADSKTDLLALARLEPERQKAVAAKVASGEISAGDLLKKAVHVSQNTGQVEWYTPPAYLDAAREVMGSIDLDPATSEIAQRAVKASHYFTADDDGLAHAWVGNVWMNPPYAAGLVDKFAAKLCEHFGGSVDQAVVLVNNATDTAWFQLLAKHASAICFPAGRIRFIDEEGKPGGAPLQGQAVLYFGDRTDAFVQRFASFGFCARI